MADVEFVESMTVEYVQHVGSDATIANSARVSTSGRTVEPGELEDSDRRLIGRLIRDRHTSTLEHCVLTVRADVTLDVRSEWHRHRVQSYNEKSGRYSEYEPRFYVEPVGRPLGQAGKSMDYTRTDLPPDTVLRHRDRVERQAKEAWFYYESELADGVCREVARRVLPTRLMTQFYATANLHNWLQFIERRGAPDALHEIRWAAWQVGDIIDSLFPVSYRAWEEKRTAWL